MKTTLILAAAAGIAISAMPAASRPLHHHHHRSMQPAPVEDGALTYSTRPSDYSNGHGTNVANSTPVTPITPYGGYVVNQYGFGNYVSGPAGYGGYPAGSAGAEIWRQRERWKCEYAPETC
jgi:hypothetical protein